jgi:imidazolonepropionase
VNILIKNIKQLIQVSETSALVKGAAMKQLPIIEDAWLAIEGDKIIGFGEMSSFPGISNWKDLQVIDADGRVVGPSWIDSHTHLVYAGTRQSEFVDRIKGLSYEEIAAKGGGIINSALKLRETSEDELYEQASNRLLELIQLGTGAIEIKSGYGLDLESELKILKVVKRLKENFNLPIKASLLAAHAVPLEFKGDADKYIAYVCEEILPAAKAKDLLDYVDIFCERNYFSAEHTAQLLEAAKALGVKAKIHVNQFSSIGGVQVACEHGALSVDHLEVLEEHDIESLKNSDCIPVALPGCSFFISIPYTPARKLIDVGLGLALASDYNPGSSPSGNMNLVNALACIKMNMSPEEVVNASTINAACALELSDELGSIAVGKKANLFVTKKIPDYSFMMYSYGQHYLDQIILNGEIQKQNGQTTD